MREGVAPVTITKTPTVAAARPRTLSLEGTVLAVPTAVGTWRVGSPRVSVPTYLRTKSEFMATCAHHNSIRSAVVAATVPVTGDRFGADKQAAPPRGVPR